MGFLMIGAVLFGSYLVGGKALLILALWSWGAVVGALFLLAGLANKGRISDAARALLAGIGVCLLAFMGTRMIHHWPHDALEQRKAIVIIFMFIVASVAETIRRKNKAKNK